MQKRTSGVGLVVIGVALAAFFGLADVLRYGKAGFGPNQTLGTVAGILIVGVGLVLFLSSKPK